MAILNWIDFNNGSLLSDIRSKLNIFNTSVKDEVNGHTTELTNHASELASHTTELANHTTTLASHTTELADHATALADLGSVDIAAFTATLDGHTTELANHSTILDNHTTDLATKVSTTELDMDLSIQVSLGTNIDTILTNGNYEVDTNLPGIETSGYLTVQEVYNTSRVVQTFKSPSTLYTYMREYIGSVWSEWVLEKDYKAFYFESTSASQVYTMRMPVGTRVKVDGTWYNGAGITDVVVNVTHAGRVEFIESVPGCIEYFVMNSNELSGTIPDLSLNKNLSLFLCSSNQLTGSIPDLSANTELLNFQCTNNQLTGSIPDLSANTKLQSFYIITNQLTGNIPDLSNNTALRYMRLSDNQLTGFDGGTIKVINEFSAYFNQLTVSAVDAILQALVDGGTVNAIVYLQGGNGIPTNTAAIDTLRANGCTVVVEGGY